MRVIDRNAISLGLTSLQMMESAGKSLAAMAAEGSPGLVLVVCGKGNNGGDGMAAARYLQHTADTHVCYLDERGMSPECAAQLALLRTCKVGLHPFRCAEDLRNASHLFDNAGLIIDAVLGTGSGGPLREPLLTCVQLANRSGAPILSADVPTPGINAARICAFHRPKVPGSEIVDIGIPLGAETTVGPGELTLVPARDPDAHKGEGGKVLVIGGGPYQGAPYLAGIGALRAGADIVRIASPVFEPIPDLIYERLSGSRITEEHLERLIPLAREADVVVCGNGLGSESHHVVLAIAPHCRKAVFDADALRQPLPRAGETIYTPHAGEFVRMTGNSLPDDPVGRGRSVKSAAISGTILLKGRIDVISDGARVRFNKTGTPGMAVGGTGDVLAGVVSGLFCRIPAFEAACIAAYVNGRAGAAAESVSGGGILASEVADMIPGQLYGGK
ncbi:MAG: NAD(P)H-hydrate dehydratase [Methanoregulaceae archaeon]|nr:NAD(P)H-hydrate dehydratase [Methanoregulaceae archaeon]